MYIIVVYKYYGLNEREIKLIENVLNIHNNSREEIAGLKIKKFITKKHTLKTKKENNTEKKSMISKGGKILKNKTTKRKRKNKTKKIT